MIQRGSLVTKLSRGHWEGGGVNDLKREASLFTKDDTGIVLFFICRNLLFCIGISGGKLSLLVQSPLNSPQSISGVIISLRRFLQSSEFTKGRRTLLRREADERLLVLVMVILKASRPERREAKPLG